MLNQWPHLPSNHVVVKAKSLPFYSDTSIASVAAWLSEATATAENDATSCSTDASSDVSPVPSRSGRRIWSGLSGLRNTIKLCSVQMSIQPLYTPNSVYFAISSGIFPGTYSASMCNRSSILHGASFKSGRAAFRITFSSLLLGKSLDRIWCLFLMDAQRTDRKTSKPTEESVVFASK